MKKNYIIIATLCLIIFSACGANEPEEFFTVEHTPAPTEDPVRNPIPTPPEATPPPVHTPFIFICKSSPDGIISANS